MVTGFDPQTLCELRGLDKYKTSKEFQTALARERKPSSRARYCILQGSHFFQVYRLCIQCNGHILRHFVFCHGVYYESSESLGATIRMISKCFFPAACGYPNDTTQISQAFHPETVARAAQETGFNLRPNRGKQTGWLVENQWFNNCRWWV